MIDPESCMSAYLKMSENDVKQIDEIWNYDNDILQQCNSFDMEMQENKKDYLYLEENNIMYTKNAFNTFSCM